MEAKSRSSRGLTMLMGSLFQYCAMPLYVTPPNKIVSALPSCSAVARAISSFQVLKCQSRLQSFAAINPSSVTFMDTITLRPILLLFNGLPIQKYRRQLGLTECENDFLVGCSRLYSFLP